MTIAFENLIPVVADGRVTRRRFVMDFLPLGLADGRLKRDPPQASGSTTDDPMSDSPAGRSPALAKSMIAHLTVARECEPSTQMMLAAQRGAELARKAGNG